ncbi:MAG: hypothetical protein HQ538_06200 [Parcubacteria group bacterium]|nr:hypothetical protein [Parcubacteria group bacterium]
MGNPEGQFIHHRGLRVENKDGAESKKQDLPNSFEALLRANPGDTLETDVFLLEDGSLAIAHNKDLDVSMEEIEEMDIEGFEEYDNPQKNKPAEKKFSEGKMMPLFDEILGQAYDRDVNMLFELKASSVDKIKDLADAMVDKIVAMRDAGAFEDNPDFLKKQQFFSFSIEGMEHLIARLKKEEIEAETMLLWTSSEEYAKDMEISKTAISHTSGMTGDWFEKGVQVAKDLGVKAISTHVANCNSENIKIAQDEGLEIAAICLNCGIDKIEELKKLGIDRFISEELN